MGRREIRWLGGVGSILIVAVFTVSVVAAPRAPDASLDVVISEIAWMGTTTSHTDEWIELINTTGSSIDLAGWTLNASDGIPSITLSGSIPAGGHFLLERSDDSSVPGVAADQVYSGGLANEGEDLVLRDDASAVVDRVDCSGGWFAGHGDGRVPMVRADEAVDGSQADNWTHNPRCGSPTNSTGMSRTCTLTTTAVGAPLDYSVFFNERFDAASTTTDQTAAETALLSFIGNATTTLDVAVYGLNRQSVVDALMAAYNRGVTVRVVGDDEAATGDYAGAYQELVANGITVVTDTSTSKIQHNKFVVIDGGVTWTGSANFTDTGLTLNANHSIVITDTTLAGVYTAEFEEMWAGTFHGDKADNTAHHLDYDGRLLESFFAPTDLVAFEVWEELANADETLHFAMFFWTDQMLTERVIERMEEAGVAVYGVWDRLGAASPYSADEALVSAGAQIAIEDFAGKVHHKFAVIDVDGSDPTVILGSYNWTDSGAYDNDENTLIIHDADLARVFHEEWQRMWSALYGSNIHLPLVARGWASATPTPVPTDTPTPTATPTPSPSGDVVIVDIFYDGVKDSEPDEYVEIRNDDSVPVRLEDWTLRDEANHIFTFPAHVMEPGQVCRVYTNEVHPLWCGFSYGSGSPIWNNGGDCATLADGTGVTVDSYCY